MCACVERSCLCASSCRMEWWKVTNSAVNTLFQIRASAAWHCPTALFAYYEYCSKLLCIWTQSMTVCHFSALYFDYTTRSYFNLLHSLPLSPASGSTHLNSVPLFSLGSQAISRRPKAVDVSCPSLNCGLHELSLLLPPSPSRSASLRHPSRSKGHYS